MILPALLLMATIKGLKKDIEYEDGSKQQMAVYLPYSDRGIIFLIFWLYLLANTSLGYFISAFFSRAGIGQLVAALLVLGTLFANDVLGPCSPASAKAALSLFPSVAVIQTINTALLLEMSQSGAVAETLNVPMRNYSVGTGIGML